MREDDKVRLRHMLDAAREAVHFLPPLIPILERNITPGADV